MHILIRGIYLTGKELGHRPSCNNESWRYLPVLLELKVEVHLNCAQHVHVYHSRLIPTNIPLRLSQFARQWHSAQEKQALFCSFCLCIAALFSPGDGRVTSISISLIGSQLSESHVAMKPYCWTSKNLRGGGSPSQVLFIKSCIEMLSTLGQIRICRLLITNLQCYVLLCKISKGFI